MQIHHNLLLHPIRIQIQHPFPIKLRIRIMNNAVMVWTHDHLIIGIIVQTVHIVVDVMSLRDMRTIFFPDNLSTYLATICSKLSWGMALISFSAASR